VTWGLHGYLILEKIRGGGSNHATEVQEACGRLDGDPRIAATAGKRGPLHLRIGLPLTLPRTAWGGCRSMDRTHEAYTFHTCLSSDTLTEPRLWLTNIA
jgi:hypothetical protein